MLAQILHSETENLLSDFLSLSIMEYYASSGPPPPPPAPLIPSAQTAFGSPLVSPTPLTGPRPGATGYGPPPLPPPGPRMIPPPPGPPPPPVPPAPPQLAGLGDGKRQDSQPRSDLLSAIRMGEFCCTQTFTLLLEMAELFYTVQQSLDCV